MSNFRVSQNYKITIKFKLRKCFWKFLIGVKIIFVSLSLYNSLKLKTSICVISCNNIINNSRERFYNANDTNGQTRASFEIHLLSKEKRTATIPVSWFHSFSAGSFIQSSVFLQTIANNFHLCWDERPVPFHLKWNASETKCWRIFKFKSIIIIHFFGEQNTLNNNNKNYVTRVIFKCSNKVSA